VVRPLPSSDYLLSLAASADIGCITEAWPESEPAAEAAVAKYREKTAAAGGNVERADNMWTRREYILGMEARIPVIKGIAMSFKLGILKIAKHIWPANELKVGLQQLQQAASSSAVSEVEEDSDQGEAPNATTEQTRQLLRVIPRRIDVLIDSAGRTAAQTALQTVLSWYPRVELSQLHSIREGATDLLEKSYVEVNRLASTMLGWFNAYEYTPYVDDEGHPLAAPTFLEMAEVHSDSESSQTSPRSKQGRATSTDAQSEPAADATRDDPSS
jgi:hypothetical protein